MRRLIGLLREWRVGKPKVTAFLPVLVPRRRAPQTDRSRPAPATVDNANTAGA